jgi:hypothetical protein
VIFDEKCQKLNQIGSDRISVTSSDRPTGPNVKGPIFDDFDEESQKLLEIRSGSISVTSISDDL